MRTRMFPFTVFDGGEPGGPPPEPAPPAPEPEPTPPAPAPDDSAFARLRREKEAAEKAAKDAQDALAARERAEAEEQGRYKELADAEKARADALQASIDADKARRNAERSARDLKFKDPEYALYLLQQDQIDIADPAAVKAGLESIAAARADLIGTPAPAPPSGGPPGGSPPEPTGLTADQLRAMTPQQIAKLDPAVVNKALSGG